MYSSLYILGALLGAANAATPAQWRSRSIYQVLTDRFARTDGSTTAACADGFEGYCGGTWAGLTNKLDYIQGMGFDAIWISPVVENIANGARAYHGYSAKNIYNLNSHFGTQNDLKNLASALHNRGMYLMVDVVTNHFGWDGKAAATDYSTMHPFDSEEYYHPICWIDFTNQTSMEDCWLGSADYPLPDIDTTRDDVRAEYSDWIGSLVANYSLDGIRIDSVKDVEKPFWPGFNDAAGVYALGEVSHDMVNYICDYQNYLDGVFSYGNYYTATAFFSSTSATSYDVVNGMNIVNSNCKDTTLLGSFSENHDQPRFASKTSDMALAKNIIAFTMLNDGVPVIYQGQEQHYDGKDDPWDREAVWLSGFNTNAELYKFVKQMNAIRQLAIAKSSDYLTWKTQTTYRDDHKFAMRKGTGDKMILTLVNNLGAGAASASVTMSPGFTGGLKVTDVLSCTNVNVGSDGSMTVTVTNGAPMVFYPFSLLAGTGWCGQ